MSQLDLPLHRRTDPETSVEAARRAEAFKHSHISRILQALRESYPGGGMTKNEIARATGIDGGIQLDATAVARRRKEMVMRGLVRVGPEKRDGCQLWRLL